MVPQGTGEQADIIFDYDTYLLTAAKAKALKEDRTTSVTPPVVTPTAQPPPQVTPATPTTQAHPSKPPHVDRG